MTIQRQWNGYVAYAQQVALGTPIGGGGASFLPLTGGAGNVTQQSISSLLVRQDGMSVRGRGGTYATTGNYPGEMQMGNYDNILQAVMRGTWAAGGTLGGHRLINPPAGALVRRYFTVEEVELDLNQSELFQDCVWTKIDMSLQPNAMFVFTPTWMGTGVASGLNGALNFSSPTYPNANFTPLAAIDATITLGGVTQVAITAFQMTIDLGAVVPAVAGSKVSPDVFDGVMKVSMPGFTIMRQDLVVFTDFLGATPLVLQVTVAEPAPGTGIIRFIIPNLTLGQATKSDFKRDGGPMTVNIQVPDARVGIDLSGGGNPETMVIIDRST